MAPLRRAWALFLDVLLAVLIGASLAVVLADGAAGLLPHLR